MCKMVVGRLSTKLQNVEKGTDLFLVNLRTKKSSGLSFSTFICQQAYRFCTNRNEKLQPLFVRPVLKISSVSEIKGLFGSSKHLSRGLVLLNVCSAYIQIAFHRLLTKQVTMVFKSWAILPSGLSGRVYKCIPTYLQGVFQYGLQTDVLRFFMILYTSMF